ncbi:MAG: PTS sugar transporter subunit IIA [Verrucomicrobiota bacterium]
MTLADTLCPSLIVPSLKAETCKGAIDEMVGLLVEEGRLDPALAEVALEGLHDREAQCSTGVGGGIAIPHFGLEGLKEELVIFARSATGIDFCACDRAPVRFIVLFLVPKGDRTLHLNLLAAIAKTLNRAQVKRALAKAETRDQIVEILCDRQAAA